MKQKVLISCPHLQRTIDKYRSVFEENNIAIDLPSVNQQLTEEKLLKIINQYDGIIAGDDELTGKVLQKAKKLKIISKWGVGIDGIDLDAAKELNIPVINTPNVFSNEVADLTVGYIVALARKTHIIDKKVREGEWNSAQLQGISLYGKTLGVIGVGSIGREVVKRASAMGMKVVGYDIFPIPEEFRVKYGLNQVSLNELLSFSDFISLNCNLTPENYHMLDNHEFSLMKESVYIVNTARGALINEQALIENLGCGKVAGAALDVFENEPLSKENPLHNYECCIFGSHNSSNTYDAVMRVNEIAIKNLIDGLDNL